MTEPTNTNPNGYPAPQYPAAPYTQPYSQPYAQPYQQYYQPEPGWNAMAIAGFITSFLFSIVGLILSIIGLNQINRTGEKGKGLAIAGIIISTITLIVSVLLVVLIIAIVSSVLSYDLNYDYSYDDGDGGYSYDDGGDVTTAADRLAAAPDDATARLDAVVAAAYATVA